MSESERLDAAALQPERTLADGRLLPDDFDSEDIAMARLLNNAFHIQGENLPPRYAQTLLGEERYTPADDELCERVTNTVFHRLMLTRVAACPAQPVVRRHVVATKRQRLRAPATPKRGNHIVRKGMLVVAALVMLMAFESAFNGAAFANVLKYLIVGHSGVQTVKSYPTINTANTGTQPAATGDHRILFTPTWTEAAIMGYTFTGMDIMDKTSWSDSAIITLNYARHDATGVHHLVYLEFSVSSQTVLQVVQNGAAQDVAVGKGNGVFVGGRWSHRKPPAPPTWITDNRAGLICSGIGEPGLVTWIATDDVAGFSQSDLQQRLSTVAQAMQPMSQDDFQMALAKMQYLGNTFSPDLLQIFGGDVLAISSGAVRTGAPVTYLELGTSPDLVDPSSGTTPTR